MLDTSVDKITKIGPSYKNRLNNLNISTLEDLLYHFPVRYENFTEKRELNSLAAGEKVSVEGSVLQIKTIRTKFGKFLTFATISDGKGTIECVWFNQPYINRIVKSGQKLGLSGKVDYFNGKIALISPEYEFINPNKLPIHTHGLIPIYPETRGVSSKWLRSKIKLLLDEKGIKNFEILPAGIINKYKLGNWYESMKNIHFPTNIKLANTARKRFAFEEFFLIQLAAMMRKAKWQSRQKTDPFKVDQEKIMGFIADLPFPLTRAQNKVIKEIIVDLKGTKPMNRLLQGDVGSGKTVVAAIISLITYLNGRDVLFMAPTEILAKQHLQTLESLLSPYGIKVGLQTGSKKTKDKPNLLVGTHALIFSKTLPKSIGLIIIDEQHRFGVEQRSLLRNKGVVSHFLTMSATPIPRTMALTLYGDLDLSVIDELPAGRKRVKTFVVPREKRDGAYNFIREHVRKGNQVFIICPLIEPSETLVSVKNATEEWKKLSSEVFPEYSVDLLHGRLKEKEKDMVVKRFKAGESNILVSTPVVEVGIDIPNATIMMIEASERFGLAQLHQIRGRVGRSSDQSYCLLFTENDSPEILARLKNMEKKHVGLDLAELDLKIRGPGQLYGTAQHGLPTLKVANLSDSELIEKTRKEAIRVLKSDPLLKHNDYLKKRLVGKPVSPD